MVAQPKKFKRSADPPALSEAGRAIVNEAQERLDSWIDENINRLEAEWTESLGLHKREILEETAALEGEMQGAQGEIVEALNRLNQLEENWKSGDGETIEEAIASTRETIHRLQAGLDARETKIRSAIAALIRAGALGLGKL